MKRMLARLLVVLAVSGSANLVQAAGPTVILDHKLTGLTKGASTLTLNYSVHVTNPGNTPLTDLSLYLAPNPPLIRNRATVTVGYLGPHEGVYLPLQVVTPVLLDADRVERIPLFWKGKCLDADGKPMVFPAVSKPGGAK